MTGLIGHRWRGAFGLALLLAAPAVAVWFLRKSPQFDLLFESASFHVVVVSSIAACALGVAIIAMAAAASSRQPSVVLLGLGCAVVGVLMLGHGLTTPGFAGRPVNQWVGRFPLLAVAGFAGCLSAATRRRGFFLDFVGSHPKATLIVPTLGLAIACGLAVANPAAGFGSRPVPFEEGIRLWLLIASAAALAIAGYAHWRRWRLGRDRIELALVVACWLSVDALVSFRFGQLWRLSWWDYHVYLLAGFGAAAYAVVTSYRRTRSAEEALGTIAVADPLVLIARGHPEALHALIGAVEAKDPYTHGHSGRVAELSVRLGLNLGLGPDALRQLVQGAILHDIGKLGVPNEILNKPGALSSSERDWIEQHPIAGSEVAGRAPSLRQTIAVIRHHHERWDGTGYPDGLAGEQIPLAARIAAVADVWDALTSDRAYRAAWDPSRALAHIRAGRGTHFDPRCVDAFLALMAERGLHAARHGEVEVEALVAAAETCHRNVTLSPTG